MNNGEKQKQSWWSTIPGIITATAALITATGGLLIALKSVGIFDKPLDNSKDSITIINSHSKMQPASDSDPSKAETFVCTTPDNIETYTPLGVFQNHKYFLSDESTSWTSANSHAVSLGGHLLTLNSSDESDFITSATNIQAWIGFTNILTEDKYQWITGEPVKFTNWADGEPNNRGGVEHYAIINWYKGNWNDFADTMNHRFILEFDCIK